MGRDDGVSAILASVLLTAMVVAIAGAMLVVFTSQAKMGRSPSFTGVSIDTGADQLRLTPAHGETIPVAGSRLVVTTDQGEVTLMLSAYQDLVGTQWEPGESICIAGAGSRCASPVSDSAIAEIRVVRADQLLWVWTGRFAPPGGVAAADLALSFLSATPPSPTPGAPVVFSARVANAGDAAVAPGSAFTVRFLVDGVLVSEHASSTGLGAGASVDVASDAWTAVAGSHGLRIEVELADDENAANDEHSGAFDVSTQEPVADPGHAYEDVDNDEIYTSGLDIAIPDADVLDGEYVVGPPAHGLVLPPSLGPVIVGGDVLFASGSHGHLVVRVDLAGAKVELEGSLVVRLGAIDLDAASDRVEIDSQGPIEADGVRITAYKEIVLDAKGDMELADSALVSETDKVDAKVTGPAGDVVIEGATVIASGAIDLDAKGDLLADDSVITSSAGTIDLDADRGSSGDASLRDATLTAYEHIDVDVKGDLDATGASLSTTTGDLVLRVSGDVGDIVLVDADIDVEGHVQVESKGDIAADDAHITSATSGIDLDADRGDAGDLSARDAVLAAAQSIDLDAKDAIDLAGAALTSTGDKIDIDAVDHANGDVDLTGASLVSDAHIVIDAGSSANTVSVGGATIEDPDDKVKAKPSGVHIAGTPAAGTVTS